MQPLVSIIIPIYNVAPYVEQCLQSVIDQTYRNLEMLIVDDCGTDNSMEIVGTIIATCPLSFKILHHDHNRGLSAARNTGIKAATGDYLYFLDSDDWLLPTCIEKMVDCLKSHPDSQMVFSGSLSTDKKQRGAADFTKRNLPDYSNDRDWLQSSMLETNKLGVTAWNKLIRRDFVLEHDLYFVEGMIHEDVMWKFQISKYIQTASFYSGNTYMYRIRENSIMDVPEEVQQERQLILHSHLIAAIGGYGKFRQINHLSYSLIMKSGKILPSLLSKKMIPLHLSLIRHSGIYSPLLLPIYIVRRIQKSVKKWSV